jgi:hypothetical protein
VQLRLEKLGTPELENFSQSCRAYLPGALGKWPFADGPTRQRSHILFYFFAFHVDKHIYIYHMQQYITHISHPQVHTPPHVSTSPSKQVHKVSQIQRNKFTTWSTKSKGLRWVLVRWERWDGRLEDLLTTWSLVIRTRRERLHKGDKIASVRHD